MLLLLYFPFTAPLLDVVLTLLGEEKPLLIRLPSRSSCHFLFLSCLLQSSHWLLCFFFPFLPQSFCSPPAWVKPGVSFPHLPSVSRHVAFFDMWLPLPLLPPCVFLAWVWLFYQTWPRWLASSSGLEHSNVSLSYSISVQFSLLSSTFFSSLVYRAKSGIFWTFFPLAWVLLYQPHHFNLPAKELYQKFPSVACLYRASCDLGPAVLCVSKQRGKQPLMVLNVVLDV